MQLELKTTDSPEVLLRVLTALRRRGCAVVSVEFHEGDRHRPPRLSLCLRTSPRTEHRLVAWLEGLVEVESVNVTGRHLQAVA
jgi:acetolactate synthase regulatory subunit